MNQDRVGARSFTTNLGKKVFVISCDGMGDLAKDEVANSMILWSGL